MYDQIQVQILTYFLCSSIHSLHSESGLCAPGHVILCVQWGCLWYCLVHLPCQLFLTQGVMWKLYFLSQRTLNTLKLAMGGKYKTNLCILSYQHNQSYCPWIGKRFFVGGNICFSEVSDMQVRFHKGTGDKSVLKTAFLFIDKVLS